MYLYFESLGCARNQVDSDVMQGHLARAGWRLTDEPALADAIVVNTCSFIEPAVNESIDTILELARQKKEGRCRRLVVVGCLPERYGRDIVTAMPEVDFFLGTGAFDRIVATLNESLSPAKCELPDPDKAVLQQAGEPCIAAPAPMAYVKIAEGCSRHCTYCIIPKLRGRQRSHTIDAIEAQARKFIESGVKELVLVAQDSTGYGRDLQPATDLATLLRRLAAIDDAYWLRFLYGHPESMHPGLLSTVAGHTNICAYFDIPVQHAASSVLKRMGRRYSRDELLRLFDRIRAKVPDVALRTTVIVGFPGETDEDFRQLVALAETVRFDHLGVFQYSDAEDLPSHRLADHVPPEVAQARYDELMACQQVIAEQNNQRYLDRTLAVLVEEGPRDGVFLGRTAFQAPEVDGVVYIHPAEQAVRPGTFVQVKVTDTLEYDLIGNAQ